jgi:antitoxin component of MazEF toxin-antitoxin module
MKYNHVMDVKTQQVGNSLMVTIPRKVVKRTGLRKGQNVKIFVSPKDAKKITMEISGKGSIMDLAGVFHTNKKVSPEEIDYFIKHGQYEERFKRSLS